MKAVLVAIGTLNGFHKSFRNSSLGQSSFTWVLNGMQGINDTDGGFAESAVRVWSSFVGVLRLCTNRLSFGYHEGRSDWEREFQSSMFGFSSRVV